MGTLIIITVTLGIILKVSKIVKNVALSILYMVASLLGLVLLFKWVLKPLWKFIKWSGNKLWLGLRWLGNKMIDHYRYRDDNKFWYEVANSMDRSLEIEKTEKQLI